MLHQHGTECQPQPQETGHSGQHTRWWGGGGDQGPGNGRAQGRAEAALSLSGEDSVDLLKELRKLLSSAISLFSGIKQLCHHSPSPSLKFIIQSYGLLIFLNIFTLLTSRDILPEVAVPNLLIPHGARGAGPDRGYPGARPGPRLAGHELAAVAGVGRGVPAAGRGLLTLADQVVRIGDQLSVTLVDGS